MNKSFTFTAILSLLVGVAHAQEMPLLQIHLERSDIENLIAVQKQKTLAQKVVELRRIYPDLEFGRLPDNSEEDGRLIRKYDSAAGGHARILLKSPTPAGALPRELIHYFIDRARLAKYPEKMENEKQSYPSMLTSEFITINHKLMNAILHADNSAKRHWQARLTLNMLERHLSDAGEDVEAITFLIKHREELGLNENDIFRQYQELQRDLDVISERATILMEGATQGLNASYTSMEEILKWQPLADRLLGVFERLEEIETYVQQLDFLKNPAPGGTYTCEILVL
jgi:hypothetical protein